MPVQTNALSLQGTGDHIITRIDYPRLEALCRINGLRDRGNSESTEEAHNDFMSSYQKIFLQPKKAIPYTPIPADGKATRVPERVRAGDSNASWEITRSRANSRVTRDHLINCAIKALRKLPIERSQEEQLSIRRILSVFPSLTDHLSRQELLQISSITVLECWERGHTVFVCSGLHLVLKGSVRLLTQDPSKAATEQRAPTIGVGGCFGSLEEADADAGDAGDAGLIPLCAVAQDACEVLRVSQAGYSKLKKENLAQNSALKESLIQSCPFYLHWPKMSIKKLGSLIQMRHLPANHVLVTQGKVCPFVGYIRAGGCTILQDIRVLKRKPLGNKGSRVRHVVVGMLGEEESFGEASILLDQPSPCSIVTATEVKMGVILPEALKGLDSVTRSLMLQTAQPTNRELSQEQINKEYVTQQRHKEWEHTKKRVLSDALFYQGIVQGCGKWTLIRGRRQDKCGPPSV